MLLKLPCPGSYILFIKLTDFVPDLEFETGLLLLLELFPSKVLRVEFKFLVKLFLF